MCEAKVVVVERGEEKVVVEEAVSLSLGGGELAVRDFHGREYRVKGVKELRIDFLRHTVWVLR